MMTAKYSAIRPLSWKGGSLHSGASLVPAVSKQLRVAADFSSGQGAQRCTQVAEVAARSHNQAEDVAMHVSDPTSGNLVHGHDEHRLPSGRSLSRGGQNALLPKTGGQVRYGRLAGVLTLCEASVRGVAPETVPGLAILLARRNLADHSAGLAPAEKSSCHSSRS